MQRFQPQGSGVTQTNDHLYENQGDLLIGVSAGTPIKLAKGAEGTVLSSGAATLEWTDEIVIDGGSA